MAGKHISVWYFVGVLLLIYGVMILAAGIHDAITPPERIVVLANLHVGIWWGALLAVLGAVYTWIFSPWRQR